MTDEQATVFVVDDDEAVRESLSYLISSVDLQVKAFASATDFLNAFRPGLPGCLVVDVRMPGMSGLELQRQLSDRNINIPVIIITGHGDVDMAVRAMKSGPCAGRARPGEGRGPGRAHPVCVRNLPGASAARG